MDRSDTVTKKLVEDGASLTGFADFRDIETRPFIDLPFAISIGVAINPDIVEQIKNGPTDDYCEEYTRINRLLDVLAKKTVEMIQDMGYVGRAFLASDKNYVEGKFLTATFSHKMAATRSGLGWIGKNDLLITKEYGSAVRFTTVFTDMLLDCGEPVEKSLCGSCRNCVDACPAGAPRDVLWDLSLHRDDLLDIHACYSKVLELSKDLENCSTICGICIAACPWTKKYVDRSYAKIKK